MDRADMTFSGFVRKENIVLFRERLTEAVELTKRLQLSRVLEEEKEKSSLEFKEK